MSGPFGRPTGRAENANHAPSGEYAADWPTTTTSLAIARIARAVAVGVPLGTGDALGGAEPPGLDGALDGWPVEGLGGGLDGATGVAVAGAAVAGPELGVGDGVPSETGTT